MAELAGDGTSSENIVPDKVFNNEELAGPEDTKVSDYQAPTAPEGQEEVPQTDEATTEPQDGPQTPATDSENTPQDDNEEDKAA